MCECVSKMECERERNRERKNERWKGGEKERLIISSKSVRVGQ